jgi:hypothetical protein
MNNYFEFDIEKFTDVIEIGKEYELIPTDWMFSFLLDFFNKQLSTIDKRIKYTAYITNENKLDIQFADHLIAFSKNSYVNLALDNSIIPDCRVEYKLSISTEEGAVIKLYGLINKIKLFMDSTSLQFTITIVSDVDSKNTAELHFEIHYIYRYVLENANSMVATMKLKNEPKETVETVAKIVKTYLISQQIFQDWFINKLTENLSNISGE